MFIIIACSIISYPEEAEVIDETPQELDGWTLDDVIKTSGYVSIGMWDGLLLLGCVSDFCCFILGLYIRKIFICIYPSPYIPHHRVRDASTNGIFQVQNGNFKYIRWSKKRRFMCKKEKCHHPMVRDRCTCMSPCI